jgi:hypothetical protein
MAFTRRKEDFVCDHCGTKVVGTGYTNHCPHCLWSKHVDVDPGDRAEPCGGMMEPISLEGTTPHYRILFRCVRCAQERRNKVAESDEPDAVLALSARHGTIEP